MSHKNVSANVLWQIKSALLCLVPKLWLRQHGVGVRSTETLPNQQCTSLSGRHQYHNAQRKALHTINHTVAIASYCIVISPS